MPKLLDFSLAIDGTAPDLRDLSDVEMITRFPLLGAVALGLLVVGLGCDLYLLNRYRKPGHRFLFKIACPPWGIAELAVLGVLYLAANLLIALTASLFAARENLAWAMVLGGNLLVSLAVLIGLNHYFQQRGIKVREIFGLDRHSRNRGWSDGLIFYFAMIPPLIAVSIGYAALCAALEVVPSPQPVVELVAVTSSPFLLGLVIVLAVAMAPLAEEVVFRGFAYPALKRRYGTWRGLVIVSLLFAVVHAHPPSVVPLFTLGMAFGLAYELSGSIVTPIIMHALFNTANVLMLLYVRSQV